MLPESLRVADQLAQVFKTAGISHAFGMPGGEIVTFVDALQTSGIRFTLARNETAAAMMAAGTAVEGRQPGLLVTTIGPGLANGVNGIADAVQEKTPLLIVTGAVETKLDGRFTHQVIDHAVLLKPLVKASFRVTPTNAAHVAQRALDLALTAPMGPVHLDLAPDIAAAPAQSRVVQHQRREVMPTLARDDPQLQMLRDRLAAAERPLILAGFDAARADAGKALTQLAALRQIPVLTTYKAKGLVDERLPFSLGAAGLSPLADQHLIPLLAACDVLLLVGYDPIEMRSGWCDMPVDPDHIIEIGTSFADHSMYHARVRVCGPIASILEALHDEPKASWPQGEPQQTRARLNQAFASDGWGPHQIFETLADVMPADMTLTVDSGAHRILLSQKWQAQHPLSMLQSAGWCTMGGAIPLAIGAALQRRQRSVAVLGDGGLEMTLGELGTIRDSGLPIVVLVLQDQSLALIALKQAQAQLPAVGVRLGNTDYARIAEAFGGHGVNVRNQTDLQMALERAFQSTDFTLISCQIEAQSYVGRI